MSKVEILPNFIGGQRRKSTSPDFDWVRNPATGQDLAKVPLSGPEDVDKAAQAAQKAFPRWRRTPPGERVQYLYKLKQLLEEELDNLARSVTEECGKTLEEARGELQRGIENVEVACGIPTLMQGYNSEDIARGIDEIMIRQPVGVVAAITPFNFPAMIPLWFMPYAVACGNCIILKPSERVPVTIARLVRLIERTGLPEGVVQVVNGSRETVEAILDHPAIKAVSFVGSTTVARAVYARAAADGKRAQCQGGAKNPIIVLPDADMETTGRIAADSAFGCAGQRCLAASVAITVGEAGKSFRDVIVEIARKRKVGYGLEEGTEMGPVITAESKSRIEALIQKGIDGGGRPLVDGRGARIAGYEQGHFLRPTVIGEVSADNPVSGEEIFGPVLSLVEAATIEDAIEWVNSGRYGNMACLFTQSGAAARKFRHEADVGNIGINLGVAAPMAYFPFSGWKDSFFGDLHGQGRDAVDFYTQKKVVVERWPKEWSRKF
ncbi:MAG TPA: CoA-acylating methylmalonate-semialdehyde dehydrogenase [Acidobacteriota bacterium]|nr:CoA-acylating methylmalonate-semialdehyde dehydrogenase [Acidobacteriota bacterium]